MTVQMPEPAAPGLKINGKAITRPGASGGVSQPVYYTAQDPQLIWTGGANPVIGNKSTYAGYLYQLRASANPADQRNYNDIVDRLARTGADTSSVDKVDKLWSKALKYAGLVYNGGKGSKDFDVFQALDFVGKTEEGNIPTYGVETVNDSVKRLAISTPEEAKGALTNAAQELLGRDPTNKELKLFTNALNSIQRANPEITKTTGQRVGSSSGQPSVVTNPDGSQVAVQQTQSQDNTTQTTTGGFSQVAANQYTTDFAKSADDYAEYQAETTFMNALLSAIESPVNI